MALITCGECDKAVSSKAVNCPNCGFPVGQQAQLTTPTMTPAKESKPAQVSTLLGAILIIGMSAVAILAVGYFSTQQNVSHAMRLHSPTKAEWRSKVSPFFNPYGARKLVSVEDFKAEVGEPSRTQELNGKVFWYFDCADGTVQIEMINPNLTGGKVAIDSVNDY